MVDTRDAYMADFPAMSTSSRSTSPRSATSSTSQPTARTLLLSRPTTPTPPSRPSSRSPTQKASPCSSQPRPNSQKAFFVRQENYESEGVTALSDLEGETIALAAAPDCEGRADCEGGLTGVYGIDIAEILAAGSASPKTSAVNDGEAEVGLTGTIEPTVEEDGFIRLEDDRGIQPAQNLIPAVSSEFLADNEDVEGLLNDLMAALDNDTLNELLGRSPSTASRPRTSPRTSSSTRA